MRILTTMALTLAFTLVAGCNTIAGFGKDITKGAEKVEETIDDATD